MQVSLQYSDFIFFRYIPRSEIAGSYHSSIFIFFEEPPYCLHSGCTNLRFQQQSTRVPFLHILTCYLVSLIKVLMISAFEHLLMFSLEKWLFRSLTHFKIRLLVVFALFFFYNWVEWAPFMFWIWTPYQIHGLQIFFPIP